jgi:hypothetical protein
MLLHPNTPSSTWLFQKEFTYCSTSLGVTLQLVLDDCSIQDLAAAIEHLPPAPPSLFLSSACSLMSTDPPTCVDEDIIFKIRALSSGTVEAIYTEIRGREAKGEFIQSVKSPDAREGRLPLWCLLLWRKANSACLESREWSARMKAIKKHLRVPSVLSPTLASRYTFKFTSPDLASLQYGAGCVHHNMNAPLRSSALQVEGSARGREPEGTRHWKLRLRGFPSSQ